MATYSEKIKEVQERANDVFEQALKSDIHVPNVSNPTSDQKKVVFIGENVQLLIHKLFAAHDAKLEKEATDVDPALQFREANPCYVDFQFGREEGIMVNDTLLTNNLNTTITEQMNLNVPKLTAVYNNKLLQDEKVSYGMVSGIIQRQQRDNIITAINSADVVVIYSARSISKDVMSLISESDLLTRIMMVQGVTLERVPKIIFANANMPSDNVDAWRADVLKNWSSMIEQAQNEIGDANSFSTYIKSMRDYQPSFTIIDHEAFSLVRFGKPVEIRALKRLLDVEDSEIQKAVSELDVETQFLQFNQRLNYILYAIQNESKRVLSNEVFDLLTFKPVHALFNEALELTLFKKIQDVMKKTIPAVTANLFDVEISLPRDFAQMDATKRYMFAKRNFMCPLKWNGLVQEHYAAASNKIDAMIVEHLGTQVQNKAELSADAKIHFMAHIKNHVSSSTDRFEKFKYSAFKLSLVHPQIKPQYKTVQKSNDVREIKEDSCADLRKEMKAFTASLRAKFECSEGDFINFKQDIRFLVEDALKFMKKPLHEKSKKELGTKTELLLHDFSQLYPSKFFVSNLEGPLKHTLDAMIENDKIKLRGVVNLMEKALDNSNVVSTFTAVPRSDPPYFPFFDAVANILMRDGSPSAAPRKSSKSDAAIELAVIMLRKCLTTNKKKEWIMFLGFVLWPAGFGHASFEDHSTESLIKLLDDYFLVSFTKGTATNGVAIVQNENSCSVIRLQEAGEPSTKKAKM